MISKGIERFCKDYQLIENYDLAINDETQTWHCHHRLETDLNVSGEYLIENNLYFNVKPEDLIFLLPSEHRTLHNKSKYLRDKLSKSLSGRIFSEEHKRKMSDYAKTRIGDKNPAYGKHWYNNGIKNVFAYECPEGYTNGYLVKVKVSDEGRKKMQEANKGKHWYTNGSVNILAYSCPDGFYNGRVYDEETRKKLSENMTNTNRKRKKI